MNWATPFPPARRRRFFLMLVPILALAQYRLWANLAAGFQPEREWLALALGVPPVRGLGFAGLLLTYFLPVYAVLAWMREGMSLKGLRKAPDLWRYILMGLVLCQGWTVIAFVVVHKVTRLFLYYSLDDYPQTMLAAMTVTSVAAGLFYYRWMLSMEVMTTAFLRRNGRHGE